MPRKRPTDGRLSAWTFQADVAHAITEATKSATIAYEVMGTNPKTGRKLLDGEAVRRDIAKDAANHFLDFVIALRDGGGYDPNRFHVRDLNKAIKAYAVDTLSWEDLVQEVASAVEAAA